MLAVGTATAVVFLEFPRAVLAEMVADLHHRILEQAPVELNFTGQGGL